MVLKFRFDYCKQGVQDIYLVWSEIGYLLSLVSLCLIRFGAQVSSPQRRTSSGSQSCLRTSWPWSTWSAHSSWLCVNCWSCSPSAQTTCCVFSWWCNSEPSSQMMRWDRGRSQEVMPGPYFFYCWCPFMLWCYINNLEIFETGLCYPS